MSITHRGLAAPAEPEVLLVRPAGADPVVLAALVRIRGELVADGFEVTIAESEQSASSAEVMSSADKNHASATIGLFLKPDGQGAELWVVDQLTHKTVVRQVDTPTGSSQELSEVLAVRAVELLRASLLESIVIQRHRTNASNAQPQTSSEPRPVEQKVRAWASRTLRNDAPPVVGIQLGAAMLWHPGELGPGGALAGRFDWFVHPVVHPRLSFVGLGTQPRVQATEGEASVAQGYGLIEVALVPWSKSTVRPSFTLGVGAWCFAVEGRASWPYEADHFGRFSLAADAGVGLTVILTKTLAIVVEEHLTLALPQPVVRFAGASVATLGLPAVTSSLTLSVSL